MNPKLKKFLPVIIIVAGVLILMGMSALKPAPVKVEKKPNIPIVETLDIVSTSPQIIVRGTGLVRSISEINIVPEVAGKIIYKSKKMISGGFFKKGELLYQIDPSDYKLQYNATKAEVAIQQVNYDREIQEQEIAAEEWKLYAQSNPDQKATDLALRKPQLAMAKANLDAANARLAISDKNLQRTKIYAPYNGSVIKKMMDVGQFVSPGMTLAQIFSSEKSQITVSLDPQKAGFIEINNDAMVNVQNQASEKTWAGKVVSVGGALDAQSRLINVTIEVDNPYEYEKPMLNGSFVNVDIQGVKSENSYLIPLSTLRNNETIWLLGKDNSLIIQKIELVHIQNNQAIIKAELSESKTLITSMLSNPINGITVRVQ